MNLNSHISKLSKKIPLNLVIIVPFVIEIFAVVGLTGWLSFRNGQEAVDDLSAQLRSEITTRIHQHLETNIKTPHRLNQINADFVDINKLDLTDVEHLKHYLWNQIQQFDMVSYVGIGTESGKYVGVQSFDNGSIITEIRDQTNELKIWNTDKNANNTTLKKQLANYDHRQRPWYVSAVEAGKPVWSKAFFSSRRTTLSVNQPIYDSQNDLLAVTTTDVNILAINQFLRSLKIGQTGQSFIMESSGIMVANSVQEKTQKNITSEQVKEAKLWKSGASEIWNDNIATEFTNNSKQFKAYESTDNVTKATANYLIQYFGEFNKIEEKQNLNFIHNGDNYFLQIVPFKDEIGLDWLIVVVVPEADFMTHIDANMYYTILLCLLALIVTILVGILTAKWIIRPLLHLNTAATALSKGEWQQQIAEAKRNDEIGELAKTFTSMAQQLQASFTTLEAKNVDLQRLDKLKDEFLANTSHELRTPLNGIIGIAESLIDGVTGKLSDETNSELSMIVASGRRLSNIINDILDFSKQKYKNIELQLEAVDIKKVTDIVLRFCQPLVGNKNLQLINEVPNDLPLADADENRVQQILHNLVGNAIKFTKKGRIQISAEVKSDNLNIIVSDTGIGIPEDKIPQIFESFEQGVNGSGLGLAISKQLVLLHKGKVWVESTLGIGSRFIFTLPISDISILNQSGKITSATMPTSEALISDNLPEITINKTDDYSNISIMIVDDEPINLHVLTNHLSMYNYTTIEAASGIEALDNLEQGNIPDLILLDVMMPRMTGYEVTQKIRETWEANELPIVLLTAKNQVADLVTGLEMGANDYLIKPIAKSELLARIKTHLHIKQLKEETLRLAVESERRLTQFLEAMPVGVLVTDADANPYYANKRAQNLLDTNSEKVGQFSSKMYIANSEQLYPPEKQPNTLALQGRSITVDNIEIHQQQDTKIPIEAWASPIFNEEGAISYAMMAFQDITERKLAELEREQFNQQLLKLNQELEDYSHTLEERVSERTFKLEEAKKAAEDMLQQLKTTQEQLVEAAKMSELGNLVAGVAHEINTPVGIGVTAASRLETLTKEIVNLYKNSKMKRADLDKYLESTQKGSNLILKNLTRAADLIHSFKQVAVDQAGEQQRTFAFGEYLREILTTLRPEFKRTKHEIVIECDDGIVLSSYPGVFSQIITNFVMNSLIHGFRDKLDGHMKIVVEQNDDELTLRYSDDGKGIPADIVNKVFDPFFTTNRQGGGSGLGMHIVYNLVTHQLNGVIKCNSVAYEGTTFIISIPNSVVDK
ncbi:ATP-binding protein [Candidatus Halobeggiatoa sp. HSG11]|nr:ATP-binding protein [Candidatus Halobeggiatoa sp. HSG11]